MHTIRVFIFDQLCIIIIVFVVVVVIIIILTIVYISPRLSASLLHWK